MRGYTLIELIIAIVVLSIAVLGIALLFMEDTKASVYSKNLIQAENLARLETTKVENIAFGHTTLADGYTNTTTAYEGYPLDLNRQVAIVPGTSNNLKKVTISIYPTGTTDTIVKVIAYKASVVYGNGSGGGGVGGWDEADDLSVTGGSIKKKQLKNITMENTGSEEIEVTKVKVTFTGASGIKLKKIKMNNDEVWSGNASSGTVITLDEEFEMDEGESYSKGSFEFSKNVSTVIVDYYELSDGSQSDPYSWP